MNKDLKEKKCSKCGLVKPITDFYFDSISGPRHKCKQCENTDNSAYNKLHPEVHRKVDAKRYLKNPQKTWARATRAGHKRTGFDVIITLPELESLAHSTKNCFYCNCEIDWSLGNKGGKKPNSPSLDRLNNEQTLTTRNVVICCDQCNTTKGNRTFQGFIDYCTKIANRPACGYSACDVPLTQPPDPALVKEVIKELRLVSE